MARRCKVVRGSCLLGTTDSSVLLERDGPTDLACINDGLERHEGRYVVFVKDDVSRPPGDRTCKERLKQLLRLLMKDLLRAAARCFSAHFSHFKLLPWQEEIGKRHFYTTDFLYPNFSSAPSRRRLAGHFV